MRFSRRTPADLALNELSRAMEVARKGERSLIDLTVSNPTAIGLAPFTERIRQSLAASANERYEPHPRGLSSARAALASWLVSDAGPIDPERIWLTASTSEAYGFLIKLLADPEDEILLPFPSYPLFEPVLRLEAVRSVSYPLLYNDRRWEIDFKALEGLLTPQTRAVIVVNPNNPTGSYIREEERTRLEEICRKRNVAILADEVFWRFPLHSDVKRTTFAKGRGGPLTFTMGGLSKVFGLPQLKLGWIYVSGEPDLVREASERLDWITDAYLSVSTPVQNALPVILEEGEHITESILARVRANHELLASLVNRDSGWTYVAGDGGWSAILTLPSHLDEDKFALQLLEREGIGVFPGHYFDLPFDASLVLSLLVPTEHFRTGVRSILSMYIE